MVLIAIPHRGNVCVGLTEKLLEVSKRDDVEVVFSSDRPVDSNRCSIASDFLGSDHDYLLMLDSDIIPPDNFLELVEHGEDVVSATVFSMGKSGPYPVAAVSGSDGKLSYFRGWNESVSEDSRLARVDAVGTACVAVHRRVFEGLDQPFFEFRKDEDGVTCLSEDFDFSEKAVDNGFDVFVDLELVAGHKSEVDLSNVMEMISLAFEMDKEKANFVGVHR